MTLLAVKNAIFDIYGLSNLLSPKILEKFPEEHPIHKYAELLAGKEEPTPGRGLYPEDITEEEFEALGDAKAITNSTVVRVGNDLEVIINEDRFEDDGSTIIYEGHD